MKPPRIPPLIIDIVQSGLLACEGIVFDSRDTCPACGGELSGTIRRRSSSQLYRKPMNSIRFMFSVKRFSCRECHAICFADEPFYPDTRIGSPLVDLCRTLGATMPFNRAAAHLLHLGIVIDRGYCTELYERVISGNSHNRSLWDPSSPVDHFTLRARCPVR